MNWKVFAHRIAPRSQPTIRSALASKEAVWKAQRIWVRWLYDVFIQFNVQNSLYFQQAIDATSSIGPRYKEPSYHDICVNFLTDCKKEQQLHVNSLYFQQARMTLPRPSQNKEPCSLGTSSNFPLIP